MAGQRLQLGPGERETLLRTARSRKAPHGLATRARIVVDCADLGVAEAAKRAAVSPMTAAKWRQRYLDSGIEGLRDLARTGRPSTPDDVVRRILSCTLGEPPAGIDRWTTRAVADATGASQATVSRTRRRYFPRAGPAGDFLHDRASVLAYVSVHADGCALGFHAGTGPRGAPASRARADAIETVLCAALLIRARAGDAVAVLRRAAEQLPAAPAATLVLDVDLDAAARAWLLRHPGITAHSVTGDAWLGLLHRVADAVDPRQLAELRQVQRLIRLAPAGGFTWSRADDAAPALAAGGSSPLGVEPSTRNLTQVVRGICAAVADGELHAAEAISVRHVARRSGIAPGRVADALAQLATETLIDKQAGRYLLPAPAPRDVVEIYTARGLLGAAIIRRLASAPVDLPPIVEEQHAGIVRCHELGMTAEACSLDLDLQDELARAADMPRIGSMFVRLTLQLRLFLALFGLTYRYPTDEIVTDDRRILDEIRRRDPDAAAEAWRSKIDNCVRYMLARLRPMV